MKNSKWIIFVGILLLGSFMTLSNANALSPETELLLKLLEKKGIITNEEASALSEEIKALKAQTKEIIMDESKDEGGKHYHSVKGLAERVRRVEDEVKEKKLLEKWADRITLSGVVEVEANYEDVDFRDPAVQDTDTSDITLAKVELGVDADIAKHVKGHALLLWEEDDTEPVDLDEGFIIIDGEDKVPLYLNAGKMYVPFGYFESHFISNPITLALGETRESAVKGGFGKDWIDLCVAAFNGDIDETGKDNQIESYVARAMLTLPEDTVSGLGLMVGASYISNIGDSNGLGDDILPGAGTIKDHVGGFSAFVSASFMDTFVLEAEYLGATDDFEAGELSFDGGNRFKPRAWNIELAYAVTESLEFAAKYEGGDDLGDFQPDKQYGGAISYGLYKNTSLALEYLHGEFENDDERNLVTSQIAVEF